MLDDRGSSAGSSALVSDVVVSSYRPGMMRDPSGYSFTASVVDTLEPNSSAGAGAAGVAAAADLAATSAGSETALRSWLRCAVRTVAGANAAAEPSRAVALRSLSMVSGGAVSDTGGAVGPIVSFLERTRSYGWFQWSG